VRTYEKRASGRFRIGWILALLALLFASATYFHLHPEALPQWAARTSIGQSLQTTTVYRWQDESGQWHVSDRPPPAGTEYRVEEYDRDVNVLPLPPELQH
jgi:hypothetical protein